MYYFIVYNILWRMSTEKHKKERKSVDFPHIPDRLSVPIDYMAALFLVKLGSITHRNSHEVHITPWEFVLPGLYAVNRI